LERSVEDDLLPESSRKNERVYVLNAKWGSPSEPTAGRTAQCASELPACLNAESQECRLFASEIGIKKETVKGKA